MQLEIAHRVFDIATEERIDNRTMLIICGFDAILLGKVKPLDDLHPLEDVAMQLQQLAIAGECHYPCVKFPVQTGNTRYIAFLPAGVPFRPQRL
ncbi:hypothetical protein BA898_05630 [Spiribacter roseus]|nr:hypothetical protein BA898_05630 [Spiribacter roseus]